MNVILYGSYLASDETARNRYWAAEFKRIEADSAFGRARRAAFVRRFVQVLGFAAERTTLRGTAETGAVPIDAIVGAVEPRTGILGESRTSVLGRVPALKRRWKETWRRLWAEEDLESLPALPVIRGADGWYLVDLPRSLLVLEVLRAKGVREVRTTTALPAAAVDAAATAVDAAAGGSVATAAGAAAVSCVEVERGGKRPTYRLVECDRGYACCADDAGVAV